MNKRTIALLLIVLGTYLTYVPNTFSQDSAEQVEEVASKKKKKKKKKKGRLPEIDLTNWKVTLPVTELRDGKQKPVNIEPPEINDFASIEVAKEWMYIDSTVGAIVFHAKPTESTTANTKYTRSELREQMVPGDNNVNWTFADGAYMKGTIQMESTTSADSGKYHRTIIMQIHGRLTDEQRDLIGEDDNNAPPILKIYWDNGRIRIKSKTLKNLDATYEEMLHEDAWDNDDGYNFPTEVGFGKFTLEVDVSDGKMMIILNGQEYKTYDGIHIEKWGIFENYFKAGNYFQSRDEGSSSRVRFYKLEVSHPDNTKDN